MKLLAQKMTRLKKYEKDLHKEAEAHKKID
ncbi:MAG: hypothetical protein ACJA19_001092 [Bacteroidia bacterium]|jgi:hypothetical protein